MNVVITGTSRGIGLEFAVRYAGRGDHVFATARKPRKSKGLVALAEGRQNVSLHVLDVASEASIRAFAKENADVPVDLLINNAGIGGVAKRLPEADLSRMLPVFRTNSVGPVLLTQALLPNLRAGKGKKVVHITSRMGSITDHPAGGYYAYRMSKAALNMASVLMAVDLKRQRIVSVVLNPGWVATEMGGPSAKIGVEESVAGMMKVIDGLGRKQSGRAFHYDGSPIPY